MYGYIWNDEIFILFNNDAPNLNFLAIFRRENASIVQIRSIAHFRQSFQQTFPAIDSRAENRSGRWAKKNEQSFLRALRASARVQAFEVLVAVCLPVQSLAESSAFSRKLPLPFLRFLRLLLLKFSVCLSVPQCLCG